MTGDETLVISANSGRRVGRSFLLIALCSAALGGCVSSEKYEAEKARALNFQRLLAQEEKRTGELNVKYQEAQRQVSAMDSQNRDLTTELDALREQMTRTQEELGRLREGGGPGRGTESEDLTLAEPSISEFGFEDVDFKDDDFTGTGTPFDAEPAMDTGGGSPTYHTVSKGETLYRLSREYGVTVDDIKSWNDLSGNLISVGQRLVVSQP